MFSKSSVDPEMHVLGLMSGTSGDGVDGALVTFRSEGGFTLQWDDHFPFPLPVRERLQKLMSGCHARDVLRASSYLGTLYSRAVATFRDRHPEPVDLLAAHGQTLDHDPEGADWDGIPVRGSLQVLNAGLLAEESHLPVVSDFRIRDMAVGGQGAPLVPFGDLAFFGSLCRNGLVVLNVGGIANLTVIRPAVQSSEPRVSAAFDTGPGNMLMDALAERQSGGSECFDREGRLAASGAAHPGLLTELLEDSFLAKAPPKSTGRDRFGRPRLEELFQSWKDRISNASLMATLLDFTVESIARAIERFVAPDGPLDQVIIAGGGALNFELFRRLEKRVSSLCPLSRSDKFGVPVQAREAMAFAALGWAFARNQAGNIPVATGAVRPVVLGTWVPASPRFPDSPRSS